MSLIKAYEVEDFELIIQLLEYGISTAEIDNDGNTILILASQQGDIEFVKLLLSKGASTIEQNKNGFTLEQSDSNLLVNFGASRPELIGQFWSIAS